MSDLLDTFLNAAEIFTRYGIKGCLLAILGIALFIAAIVALAMMLG